MMVNTKFLQLIAKLIAILCLLMHAHVLCDGSFNTQLASEAEALLDFKKGLKDPSNILSSWTVGKYCCNWKGVGCNTTTGHVISLNLHSSNSLHKLQGHNLSSSLLKLPHLSYLNLSGIDFMQSTLPSFLGAMQNLKHLDLSHANFKGSLFDILGNLSLLESLDLSGNGFYFNSIPDWLFENCHHLQNLNLSKNNLQGPIPNSIGSVTTLATVDLSHNILSGSIPDSIGMLSSLVSLDLSYNMLTGSIPSTLGQAHDQNSFIKELRLSNNHLNGSLERNIHQLSKLVVLDLAQNNLEGNITDVHLAYYTNLKVLDLSFNHHVTLNMSKNWVPPFQLETIGLAKCQLGPQFPKWIQTQKNFTHIDISNASVFDTVPNWFWDLSPKVEYMNLSYNELSSCGHNFSQKLKLKTLDLSRNNFSCPLPHLPPNSKTLDLSNNLFYGTTSQVCEILGFNNSLESLDLSYNNLSGVIPNCWTNGTNVIILNLANNNFTGLIPDSFGCLAKLHMLIMSNNNLSGKIPNTLRNCPVMTLLDLQSNRFSGPIPSWIGTDMPILKALILGRNSFDGNIPISLCQLKSLQILDLSQNRLRGEIPRCVFPAMATDESVNDKSYMEFLTIKESISTYLSERKFLLPHLLERNFLMIDLSSNNLTQHIPVEMAELAELISLNLSRNQLVGSIPSNIGELQNLVFLDLSRNHLSCAIPTSMANIDRLSALDLTYNTLSGKIPIGTQLQSFPGSSFEGNPHLCGEPLDKACPRNSSFKDAHCSYREEHEIDSNHEDNGMDMEINPFYISMGIGFSTGFWVFWGSLILVASWRHAYFRFLSNTNDRIYVTVVVAYNKLRRKLHAQQPPM